MNRTQLINNLCYRIKAKKYLEIGINDAHNFNNIICDYKVGVDPNPNCQHGTLKTTSDEFFKNHINKKYDIIFIDGLHTAYQVTKDIYNSINNLKKGGIIILDDVYPHNENEQFSVKLFYNGPQTGDVWKAVYNVLDKFIEISDEIIFINNTI